MPDNVFIPPYLSPCKACWDIWLSDKQPRSDDNGQWQGVLWQCLNVRFPTHRVFENWKMYAVSQIKISSECWDMVPKVLAGLSGTPGQNRSLQTRLAWGTMAWYSAQILICLPMLSLAIYFSAFNKKRVYCLTVRRVLCNCFTAHSWSLSILPYKCPYHFN